MRAFKLTVTFGMICSMFAAIGPVAGANSIVTPGAKLEKLADGFSFTEGPASDGKGNVFFTDQPNDRILEWSRP